MASHKVNSVVDTVEVEAIEQPKVDCSIIVYQDITAIAIMPEAPQPQANPPTTAPHTETPTPLCSQDPEPARTSFKNVTAKEQGTQLNFGVSAGRGPATTYENVIVEGFGFQMNNLEQLPKELLKEILVARMQNSGQPSPQPQ